MSINVEHYGGPEWGLRSTRYSPALRMHAKMTPGLRWEPSATAWIGYADAVDACVTRMRASKLIVSGDVADDNAGTTTLPIAAQGLHAYQVEGVSFLVGRASEGALLADAGGLGKTSQALRAARALRSSTTLVVCPSFARGVWQREVAKWWPGVFVEMLGGTKPYALAPAKPRLFVVHYDIVHAWKDLLVSNGGIDLTIFDECHALQSDKSRRSNACREIARASAYRIGLSGTPMTNRPKDLWNVVDTLSEGRFGRAFDYYKRHCDAHREEVARDTVVWKFDGATNLDELQRRLSFFMLRRTAKDVALQLPAHTRQIVEVDVPKTCRMAPMAALQNDVALRKALTLAADGKFPEVVALIQQHVAEGRKVVVFTHRRNVAEALCDMSRSFAPDAAFIHGEVPQKKRDAIVAACPTVLTATIDAAGVAIDLTFADVDIFAELSWEPWKLQQAEWRLHRQGQRKPVLSQFVIARGTVDEVIRDVCVKKLSDFEGTIGKFDDKLREDFAKAGAAGTAAQLKSLYERIAGAT